MTNNTNAMRKLSFLFLAILAISSSCRNGPGTGQTYESFYGLGFQIKDERLNCWTYPSPESNLINTVIDTGYVSKPLKFMNATAWSIRMKLKMDMVTGFPILLPRLRGRNLKVKVFYRGQNIKDAKLLVYALNRDLSVVRTDSVALRESEVFRADSVIIRARGVKALSLRILAEGSDSTYERGCGLIEETVPQQLSLAAIKLSCGKKDINAMEFKDIEIPKIKREWCADLSEDSLLTADRLAPMAGRITALGESVHGSSKINRATCDFIKSGILNGNVSMVILENSMMLMLFFNRYVQGYDDVSIDQLKEFMQYGVSDIDVLMDLTEWIREHNRKAENKVRFYGNDYFVSVGRNELWAYLRNYLLTVNASSHLTATDSILFHLANKEYYHLMKTEASKIIPIMDRNETELRAILGDDFPIIRFYLDNLRNDDNQPDSFHLGYDFLLRDRKMFEHSSFLIDSICPHDQNVVVSCHLGHAEYLSSNIPYHKPFGWYMKERYDDDYVCLAQTVLKDEARAGSTGTVTLGTPSMNSLEYTLSQQGMDYLFISSDHLGRIVKKRNKGSQRGQQEDYACPRSQFDGILHIN